MKVRIKATGCDFYRFCVQEKCWYGWRTLYNAMLLKYCIDYVEDLKKIANVELIKS